MILRDLTLFGRVTDGKAPKTVREIRVSSSQTVYLNRGMLRERPEADIWFRSVDSKTMFIESVNGATLTFPMKTLCAAP